MITDDQHPAARCQAQLETVLRRARFVSPALTAAIAIRVFAIVVLLWQNRLVGAVNSPTPPTRATLELSAVLAQTGAIGLLALLVVGGVLFLQWLHATVKLTQALGDRSFPWSAKDAVLGFIIPLANVARPYQVMRDLHDALAPDLVDEPNVQVRAAETAGYRQVEFHAPPAARSLPHASIGTWWTFFWIGNVVAYVAARQSGTTIDDIVARNVANVCADAIEIVSAGLAVLVVRAVTARVAERYRRIRHTSVDALQAAGIVID